MFIKIISFVRRNEGFYLPSKCSNSYETLFSFYLQDVRVPVQLQRAMAAEAEAAREARAKVVAAEGEQKASLHLKEAALVLEESTSALQLRYLQVDLCSSKV